jgi:flagellar motor switch protein FliN
VSGAEQLPDADADAEHGDRAPREWDRAAMESLLHDVPLEVSIELGRVQLTLGELSHQLTPGAILALDKAATAPLEVRVHSRLVARAEAVAIGDRCGIRILELVGGKER